MTSTTEQNRVKETLALLQARGDDFTRQLHSEKQRVEQLQIKIQQANDDIIQTRTSNKEKAITLLNILNKQNNTTTSQSSKNSDTTYNRRVDGIDLTQLAEKNQKMLVKKLESRLNKAYLRNNEIQNENNRIKDKIDKLRRKIFTDTVSRNEMEKKVRKIQNEMDTIMKKAAIASDKREKILEKKSQLLNENVEDKHYFSMEYEKLGSYISEQALLLEKSIAAVASDVVSKSAAVTSNIEHGSKNKNKSDNKNSRPSSAIASNKTEDTIKTLDQKIIDMEAQFETNKKLLKQSEEKIFTYQEYFEKLQEVSNLQSTEEIIKAFVKNEEETFSLFNYIQTVNQEKGLTLDQYMQLENEMESFRKDQQNREMHKASIVHSYETELEELQRERLKMKDIVCETKTTIEDISEKVNFLFQSMKCEEFVRNEHSEFNQEEVLSTRITTLNSSNGADEDDVKEERTNICNEEVSSKRILQFMELIEKRMGQLIPEYTKRQYEDSSQNHKRHRNAGSVTIVTNKPAIDEDPANANSGGRGVMKKLLASSQRLNMERLSDDDDSCNSDDGYSVNQKIMPLGLREMRSRMSQRFSGEGVADPSNTAATGNNNLDNLRKLMKKKGDP